MRFLLLTGTDADFLTSYLHKVVEPLGCLSLAQAAQDVSSLDEEPDGLIIVDAVAFEQAEKLVVRLRAEVPTRRVVVITASPTWQRARAAFEAGAMDYLPKSLPVEEMRAAFQQALRKPLPC